MNEPSLRLRRAVLTVHEHICYYCDGSATGADHIVPRTAGGSHAPENLIPACNPCNASKGNRRLPAPNEVAALAKAAEYAAAVRALCLPKRTGRPPMADRPETRTTIALPVSQWAELDAVRRTFPGRMPSEAELIRLLLREALEARKPTA